MRQDEQVSRYEINRNVRMIFARHDADLTKIDYSFIGNTVYLSGDLVRSDGDFSVQEIEVIVREISALPHVRDIQFDLNNWVADSSGDSRQLTRARKTVSTTGAAHRTGASGDATLVIGKTEKLTDVLDDLKTDSKKEEGEKLVGSTDPK
jgi:hypothetical protein